MVNKKKKNIFYIVRYVHCGNMPFYLIFCRDYLGIERYCVMLLPFRKLKKILRIPDGLFDPAQFGRVICTGYGNEPSSLVREMLSVRYGFDLDKGLVNEVRPL